MSSTDEGPVAAISHLAQQYQQEMVEHFDNARQRLKNVSMDFKANVSQTHEALAETENKAEKRRSFVAPLKNLVGFFCLD